MALDKKQEIIKSKQESSLFVSPENKIREIEAATRVAALLAHDFNNRLQPLIISLQFISDELGKGHPASDDFADCIQSLSKATEFIQKVLKSTKHISINPIPISIKEFEEIIIKNMRVKLSQKINLITNVTNDENEQDLDISQLSQIIYDCVDNAVQGIEEHGSIQFETKIKIGNKSHNIPQSLIGQKLYLLKLSNTGDIMKDEQIEKIFEPLNTNKSVHEGHGLSLTKSFCLIQKMSGYMDVSSDSKSGTIVSIYLPIK